MVVVVVREKKRKNKWKRKKRLNENKKTGSHVKVIGEWRGPIIKGAIVCICAFDRSTSQTFKCHIIKIEDQIKRGRNVLIC
jgi:hypothetical protein